MPRCAWLLLAAVALPSTPLLAQEQPPAPEVTTPPVTTPDPVLTVQPPVTQPVTQPVEPVTTAPPPSATAPTPTTQAPAAPTQRTTARTTRTTAARAAPARRTAAPVRTPTAPATAAAPPAAAASAPTEAAAPPAATPAPAAAPAPLPVPEEPAEGGPSILTLVIGGGLILLLAFAALNMLRHRRRRNAPEEVYHDEAPLAAAPPIYTEPAPVAAPVGAGAAALGAGALIAGDRSRERHEVVSSPIGDVVQPDEFAPAASGEAIAMPEEAVVARADAADAEELAASSAAPDGRPWLEFLMRPVRAGTSKDAAIVEFELTVGNTGTVPARDVRISTFMFAAGSAQESEMERMLIDPPADNVTEVDIEAGDAARVEASMALPREALTDETVLPVVVADARYRLPDGSEGRTLAKFEVGIPSEEGLDPFPTDRTSGLLEGVEARLHEEPERV